MPKKQAVSDTSTETIDVEPTDPSAVEPDVKAEEQKQPDLLDVVKDVVSPDKETAKEDTSASETEASEDESDEADGKEGADEVTLSDEDQEKEDKALPFNKHPRWKKIHGERKQFKADLDKATAELDELRPAAEQFETIQTFMTENSLKPDDVAKGFEIMALVVSNPEAARERLLALVDQLDDVTGDAIPADLQKRVEEGEISEDAAKELSQTRARVKLAEAKRQKAEETAQTTKRAGENANLASELNAYEEAVASADPDYADVKKPLVDNYVRAHIAQHGQPKTVDDAKKVFDDAVANATSMVEKIKPVTKKPKRVVTSTNVAGNGAAPVPKSLDEVVAMAARGEATR